MATDPPQSVEAVLERDALSITGISASIQHIRNRHTLPSEKPVSEGALDAWWSGFKGFQWWR